MIEEETTQKRREDRVAKWKVQAKAQNEALKRKEEEKQTNRKIGTYFESNNITCINRGKNEWH